MNEEQRYRLKNSIKLFSGCLFFLLLGITFVVTSDVFGNGGTDSFRVGAASIGWVAIIFSLITLVYYFWKQYPDEEFWKKQKAYRKIMERDRSFHALLHPEEQDIRVLHILRKNFVLVIPYVVALALIFGFLAFEFSTFFIFKRMPLSFSTLFLYPYVLSFTCFSFYILGYLAIGEILQRKLSRAHRTFLTDMIIDFFRAIPLIALLSLTWIILFFVKDRESRDIPASLGSALRTLSVYGFFVVLKYYTYANLAIIAFEDRPAEIPLRESFEYLRRERNNLFWIWARSGFIFAVPFFFSFILWLWNEKFHFMISDILVFIWGGSLILAFLFGLFSEQISFLAYFIATRHKSYAKNLL